MLQLKYNLKGNMELTWTVCRAGLFVSIFLKLFLRLNFTVTETGAWLWVGCIFVFFHHVLNVLYQVHRELHYLSAVLQFYQSFFGGGGGGRGFQREWKETSEVIVSNWIWSICVSLQTLNGADNHHWIKLRNAFPSINVCVVAVSSF